MHTQHMRRYLDAGLGTAVVAVPATLPLAYGFDRVMTRLRADGEPDTGAGLVEWVLIIAVVVVLVGIVGRPRSCAARRTASTSTPPDQRVVTAESRHAPPRRVAGRPVSRRRTR